MATTRKRAIVRITKNGILVLCHRGHVIEHIGTGANDAYAGSKAECEIGRHAAGLDNMYDRRAAKCTGANHEEEG